MLAATATATLRTYTSSLFSLSSLYASGVGNFSSYPRKYLCLLLVRTSTRKLKLFENGPEFHKLGWLFLCVFEIQIMYNPTKKFQS